MNIYRRLMSFVLIVGLLNLSTGFAQLPQTVKTKSQVSRLKHIKSIVKKSLSLVEMGQDMTSVSDFLGKEMLAHEITLEDIESYIFVNHSENDGYQHMITSLKENMNKEMSLMSSAQPTEEQFQDSVMNILMQSEADIQKKGLAYGECAWEHGGIFVGIGALFIVGGAVSFGGHVESKHRKRVNEDFESMKLFDNGKSYISQEDFNTSYSEIVMAEARRLAKVKVITNPIALDNAINEVNALLQAGQVQLDATKLAYLRVDGGTLSTSVDSINAGLFGFLNVGSREYESVYSVNYAAGTDDLYASSGVVADLTAELEILNGYKELLNTYGEDGVDFLLDEVNNTENGIIDFHADKLQSTDLSQSAALDAWYDGQYKKAGNKGILPAIGFGLGLTAGVFFLVTLISSLAGNNDC